MSLIEITGGASTGGAPIAIGCHSYVRAPAPICFPSEESPEEHVSETKRHLEARTLLYLLLKDAFAGQAIGSDQFVYWDASDPRKCLSPDLFVKLGAREQSFDIWKVWERGAPDIAVEIVSASDHRDADWGDKMARYLASGIGEVVRFDPLDRKQPVRVWDRIEGDLVERAPESTRLRECVALGLWWVVVSSAEYGPQLRLARDREGRDLLPTPDEDRMRLAEQLAEERKARSAAEHARILAEHAREQETEARKRESEARKRESEARKREAGARKRAEKEKVREAAAKEKAERERDAALAEVERLRAALARAGVGGG